MALGEFYTYSGPIRMFTGDPTQANGMIEITAGGHTEEVDLNYEIAQGFVTSAETGDNPIAGTVKALAPTITVNANLYNQEFASLLQFLPGVEKIDGTGDLADEIALGLGSGGDTIVGKTLVVIPKEEAALGINAPHAVVIPYATASLQNSAFRIGGRLNPGANNNAYGVTWTANEAPTSMNIANDAFRYAWLGAPSIVMPSWLSPEDTTAA